MDAVLGHPSSFCTSLPALVNCHAKHLTVYGRTLPRRPKVPLGTGQGCWLLQLDFLIADSVVFIANASCPWSVVLHKLQRETSEIVMRTNEEGQSVSCYSKIVFII